MQRPTTRIWTMLLAVCVLIPSLTHAQNTVAGVAPQQPGFPATPPNSTFFLQSPVIADIVPANPGKEVAIGSQEGFLSVLASDGRLLWQQQVPPTLCNASVRLRTNPAVGTLDGDSVPYVVIGYGNTFSRGNANYCPGGVAAFDGRNGALKWRLEVDKVSPSEALSGVASTPALADVDGNGTLEVAFGGLDRHMYLLDNTGSLIWRFHTADTVWSSPVFARVDGDSRLDLIFGSDISRNPGLGTSDGGFLYAFKTTPSAATNRRIAFSGDTTRIENLIWRSPNYDQTITSSPALGDVDGNGTEDLVVSSGCYFPTAVGQKNGRWIKILNPTNGAEIRTISLPFCSRSSPALGDLDGDGTLDIALSITGQPENGADGKCRIGAWRGNGTQLWEVVPTLFGTFSDPGCDNVQAPIIADVDSNGSLEVLAMNGLGVVALNGANGAQLTDQNPLTMGIPNTGQGVNGMPAVGDLDGNGTYEVVLGGLNSVFAWTNLASAISSPANGERRSGSTPWPMFRGNPLRDGQRTSDPTVQVVVSLFGATLAADSGPTQGALALVAEGSSSLRWTASEDLPWLLINKEQGNTPEALVVTFDPDKVGNNLGVYEGSISISSPDGLVSFKGEASASATRSVPVRLVLTEQLTQQFLPVVVR